MGENNIRMITQIFETPETGEKYTGVTALVEGSFKNILDYIIANNEGYNDYTEIITQAIFRGIDTFVVDIQSQKQK